MNGKRFRRLGVALLAVTALATGGATVVNAPPASAADMTCSLVSPTSAKLRYGSSGNGVKYLQCVLNDLGYRIAIDGKFGRQTLAAVRHWQHQHPYLGPVDGVVGPKTWASLRAGSPRY